ncbi:hypothetical protein ACGFW5_16155 [Streptomyces sp. NPDC048416]|uniref:hypothetical protein n=1 Tax=Streptomyces sp. NPDC048416 TaxID=3365546 RepID=UPI003720E2F0
MQPSASPSPAAGPTAGSMVGLFWVSGDEVHLGTPPSAGSTGVLLSSIGVRVTGDSPGEWRWPDVLDLRVTDAPVRSAAVRWGTRALSMAAAAFDLWVPGEPPSMTVTLITKEGDETTADVLSGAAVAYSQREVDLSLGLLARFVRGESSPTALMQWWDEVRPVRVLRSRDRETILEGWSQLG